MAISFINKKYISVSNTTDGLNNMLADIVDLICKNIGVSIINKIEYGSDSFQNYPLYNTKANGMSSHFISNTYQSDVYILGLNENNYCLIVNIYNGVLNISLGCSLDYGDRYATMFMEEYPERFKHNPLTYVCANFCYRADMQHYGIYNMSVPLLKNENDIISLTLGYYTGDNSQGFKFVVDGKESGWLLFTGDDNNNKFAVLNIYKSTYISNTYVQYKNDYLSNTYYNESPLVIPFNRVIPLYSDMLYGDTTNSLYLQNTTNAIETNTYYIPYTWFFSVAITEASYIYYSNVLARTLSINYLSEFTTNRLVDSSASYMFYKNLNTSCICSPVNSVYNLPKLANGKCYLRKLVAPDSADKFNFYLWYSPVTETPVKNSFFSVGNDVFLLVYPSMITYAIKV